MTDDALRAENARLREALTEIADTDSPPPEKLHGCQSAEMQWSRTIDWLQELARAALATPTRADALGPGLKAAVLDQAAKAAASAMFGPPSSWTPIRLARWHIPHRNPTPEEAANHDNGCRDAFIAIRALAAQPATEEG